VYTHVYFFGGIVAPTRIQFEQVQNHYPVLLFTLIYTFFAGIVAPIRIRFELVLIGLRQLE
jgi:hypothetical protein